MSLLVAILTASFIAVIGFPYKFYQYWFSWSRWGTAAGLAIYFLLAGGGGGVVGWAIAALGNADPTNNIYVNGFFYGIAGALALRADFGSRARRANLDRARDAKSILITSINWVTELLDEVSYRKADRWLRALDDDSLILEAYRINAYITGLPAKRMPDKAKNSHYARLIPLMETLTHDPQGSKRCETREQLINFCAILYRGEHLMKPQSIARIQRG